MSLALLKTQEEDMFRTSKLDANGVRTGSRTYTTMLDLSAATDEEIDAAEAFVEVMLPVARFDLHPAFPVMYARDVDHKRIDRLTWQSTIGYSSERSAALASIGTTAPDPMDAEPRPEPGESAGGGETQADLRLPELWYEKREVSEILERDIVTNDPVANAAGDPFDPGIEIKRTKPMLRFKFYRKPWAIDPTDLFNFNDCINQSPITLLGVTYPAKTLKAVDVLPKPVWEAGDGGPTIYFEITGGFEIDFREHRPEALNAGKREKVSGVWRVINDPTSGMPISQSQPLKSDGTKAAPGDAKVYLRFNAFVERDLNTLFA